MAPEIPRKTFNKEMRDPQLDTARDQLRETSNLTEADVRRIVRDEIERAAKRQRRKVEAS